MPSVQASLRPRSSETISLILVTDPDELRREMMHT